MKRITAMVAALGLTASMASATNITLKVQGPNGEPSVDVAPGGTVNYRVVAELDDAATLGIGLIGFTLDYSAEDILVQGDEPSTAPMKNFDISDGITNPDGYGGTIIGGELVQCGGAQNTIKNTDANADFPLGTVALGTFATNIGDLGSPQVVMTGHFTANVVGSHTLMGKDLFANVIRAGQDGTEAFWATDAAGAGAITNLTVNVGAVVEALLTAANPADEKTLPWTRFHTIRLTFDSVIAAPGAGEIEINELLPGGTFGPNLNTPGNFTFGVEPGNKLRIGDTASHLTNQKWYAIRNVAGAWDGVANFQVDNLVQVGDANNDCRVLFTDMGFINAQIPTTPALDDARRDINRDGSILFTDLGATNPRIPADCIVKPCGHNNALPCP